MDPKKKRNNEIKHLHHDAVEHVEHRDVAVAEVVEDQHDHIREQERDKEEEEEGENYVRKYLAGVSMRICGNSISTRSHGPSNLPRES